MKILVTGGNGQLGMSLRKVAATRPQDEFVFSDVSLVEGVQTLPLDICDPAAVMAAAQGCDVIVNCAAYTNVDKAEDDAALAMKLNCDAVANLAAAARAAGALLVHISTDYVFDGSAMEPIPETAVPSPLGVYGRTKLAGENAVRESGCRAVIIRTAWLYSEFGRNFVKTMLSLSAAGRDLKVVADQWGTPTYAGDLAEAIMKVCDGIGSAEGVLLYHFTNLGVCSWYQFAHAIFEEALGGQAFKGFSLAPCTSAEYPTRAVRPAYSVLDKSAIMRDFGISIPQWRDSLKKCLELL